MRSAYPCIAAAALLVAACRNSDAIGARDSSFVATMVELRRLPPGAGAADSAARAAVLKRRGFPAESLERAARALAADPPRAARVWGEIERRVSAAPPTPSPPPPRPLVR